MWRWNRRFPFEENGYYHIYNRWYNKSIIFNDKACFDKFYTYLVTYLQEFKNVKVLSYCFLPNHFHFIIQNLGTGTQISEFMKKLQWSYSIWHRIRYPLGTGTKMPFFEWRFKAKHIDTDEYFHQCLTYVNYNAQKHWLVEDIKDYPYTSYHKLTDNDKSKLWALTDLGELEY